MFLPKWETTLGGRSLTIEEGNLAKQATGAGLVRYGDTVVLVSAAMGFAVTSATGSPYFGVLAAMLTGGLVNLLFGYLVITRKANQLASGLATVTVALSPVELRV